MKYTSTSKVIATINDRLSKKSFSSKEIKNLIKEHEALLQTEHYTTLMFEAARVNCFDLVDFCSSKADIFYVEQADQVSMLMFSAYYDNSKFARKILTHPSISKDYIALENKMQESAFLIACRRGSLEVVKEFFKTDAVSYYPHSAYVLALLGAAQNGQESIVETLLNINDDFPLAKPILYDSIELISIFNMLPKTEDTFQCSIFLQLMITKEIASRSAKEMKNFFVIMSEKTDDIRSYKIALYAVVIHLIDGVDEFDNVEEKILALKQLKEFDLVEFMVDYFPRDFKILCNRLIKFKNDIDIKVILEKLEKNEGAQKHFSALKKIVNNLNKWWEDLDNYLKEKPKEKPKEKTKVVAPTPEFDLIKEINNCCNNLGVQENAPNISKLINLLKHAQFKNLPSENQWKIYQTILNSSLIFSHSNLIQEIIRADWPIILEQEKVYVGAHELTPENNEKIKYRQKRMVLSDSFLKNVMQGNLEILKLMLNKNEIFINSHAKLTIDNKDYNALELAGIYDKHDVLLFLLKYYKERNPSLLLHQLSQAFQSCWENKKWKSVEILLKDSMMYAKQLYTALILLYPGKFYFECVDNQICYDINSSLSNINALDIGEGIKKSISEILIPSKENNLYISSP